MALTPQQIEQARAFINAQFGGPSGAVAPDGGWQFNGDFTGRVPGGDPSSVNSLDDSMLRYLLGGQQAMGYSNMDMASILGMPMENVLQGSNYYRSSPAAEDVISAQGRLFMQDTGLGDASLVQDRYQTTRNPDGSYTSAERGGVGDGGGLGGEGRIIDRILGRGNGNNNTGTTPLAPPPAPNLTAPTLNTQYTPNPYLMDQIGSIGDSISQQFNEQIMPGLRADSILSGTYGNAKSGIAEGRAAGDAAEAFNNASMGLLAGDYRDQMGRQMQQYGMDQGYDLSRGNLGLGYQNSNNAFTLGQGQLALGNKQADNSYDLGMGQLDLGNLNAELGFYGDQRSQDRQDMLAGASIYNQGVMGPWGPLTSAGGLYNTAAGNNVTVNSGGTQGGGLMGALGGALGVGLLGNQFKWWGA